MNWKPDVNGDTFKRDDGAVIERSNYLGDSWEVVICDASDVRCKLRTKQGHTRRWKSPEAAMKTVDKEFPGVGVTRATPPPLSVAERLLVERVRLSDGGCFVGVEMVAAPLIAQGVLTGGPVANYPHYWQLHLTKVNAG